MAKYQIKLCERQLEGGIYLEEFKYISNAEPCVLLETPAILSFPLNFSGGGPGDSLVQVGDRVSKGTPIIQCVSGVIHVASRSGVVTALQDHPITHPSTRDSKCILVETDGTDNQDYLPPLNWPFNTATLRQRAIEAGILGLGGAGFPNFKKWSDGTQILIINAAECEPYLTADDTLMRIDSRSMVRGASILSQTLDIKKVIIGIEDNKPEALDAIKLAIGESQSSCSFEIVLLETKYPSGGERQLIWLALGIEVPSGSRSIENGILVHSPGTLAALSRAVDGEPITDRVVTLTGDLIAHPRNVIAPIGTPLLSLIKAAKTDPEQLDSITIGGPMMGYSISEYSAGITKTTNCILARAPTKQAEGPCIRCGACAAVCPVALQPQQMILALRGDSLGQALHEGLVDCIECAACNVVCPSHIPLAEWFKLGQFKQHEKDLEKKLAIEARERFEKRNQRLARIEADQEAKRTTRRDKGAIALTKARQSREKSI